MKTFDQMFPNLKWGDTYLIYIDGDEIRVAPHVVKCGRCENQTRFYSISFLAPYCSLDCLNEEWKLYDKDRKMSGWIGVDLDGTLAHYEGWNHGEIGEPIPAMMERVQNWLRQGKEVRIFTARASDPTQTRLVEEWLHEHGLHGLQVTNVKDFAMIELWDDRAIQVIPNTGQALQGNVVMINDHRRIK